MFSDTKRLNHIFYGSKIRLYNSDLFGAFISHYAM